MVIFFKKGTDLYTAVEINHAPSQHETEQLVWMFDNATPLTSHRIKGTFVGPRREMITPWSTNAVEIAQNMGLHGITRIEQYHRVKDTDKAKAFDPMLQRLYTRLDSTIFTTDATPAPTIHINDIAAYNHAEGLALSTEEQTYLEQLAHKLGRPLTDSEVFGFSQVNSEHCRHKIFNGRFIIDGQEKSRSLFSIIKSTSKKAPANIVSAYKDNVAFLKGPEIQQFSPEKPQTSSYFSSRPIQSVISLKAETHNFPTTVEPFNGAATGTGGEIRDRLGGGRASLPIAGTAVYMTSYPRLDPDYRWQMMLNPRVWLYQTPSDILIKASNGASDFGNKFGQPLICGSLLTFEHAENGDIYAYDKVIMLAGGVGYATADQAIKGIPEPGQTVVLMGGDNYRIGMGGGAVSSVETGQYNNAIELNAVQRANPEMQKRVANVIRALAESDQNPIVSIHDHGAGGHLNALSELVEATGGNIDIETLPVGDPTLSDKEIIGNESQERMGMIIAPEHLELVKQIAERERAPMFTVGQTTGDHRFVFSHNDGTRPIDLEMADMFGNSPQTVITDTTRKQHFTDAPYTEANIEQYVHDVLSLEAVASKDWLTNKVDRSVTGKIARQQCQGSIQLPLSDCGVVALDYTGTAGIATSIGHAPQAALIDPARGSILAVAEALTNIAGAPLKKGIQSVALSANWMWPCKNPGQDAALYNAVEACGAFAEALGISIPTGKDSLSMTQKYGTDKVYAPGTVIISAAGEVTAVRRTVSPVMQPGKSKLYYVDLSSSPLKLGGSALMQALGHVGCQAPTVEDPGKFADAFQAIQKLVKRGSLMAMHDVSAGGLVTTLLEMTFANTSRGIALDTEEFVKRGETDLVKILFAENPAIVLQISDAKAQSALSVLHKAGVTAFAIASPQAERILTLQHQGTQRLIGIDHMRDVWMRPSYLLDSLQSGEKCAQMRYENYRKQPLKFRLPAHFDGSLISRGLTHTRTERSGIRAAIIREKGINGDREMAYSLHLAGFDVKDVHMTDLTSGRETLDDVNLIVFCGGFSNSDVLGSAKGWAGGFRWNDTARHTLERYYARPDTLSLGVCNGCQLMVELGLLFPNDAPVMARMEHNISHKFESQFVSVTIPQTNSVMFGPMAGTTLGIWIAHGEGRFKLYAPEKDYNVALRYAYRSYPANPNGSPGGIAGLCSADGRHLAMMPHLERAIFPWQCASYPTGHKNDDVTPWIDAFINARRWIESHN